MITLLTTARKATVAAAIAFLSPPTALLVSAEPVTWRAMIASLLVGIIAGLTTYETPNTDEYGPLGQHHPKDQI